MPIGKNAIKRISNDGYSQVKTSAPDMENSVVTEEKPPIEEKKVGAKKQPTKKATTKKTEQAKAPTPKKTTTPKKSMETEPSLAPVKTAEKVIKAPKKSSKRQGEGFVNIGGELPIHLL